MERLLANLIPTRFTVILWYSSLYSILTNIFLQFCQFWLDLVNSKEKTSIEMPNVSIRKPDAQNLEPVISEADIKMVMDKLGIIRGDHTLQENRYDSSEIFRLFEESEPSLEEVKKAFDIFDHNKDGFIDDEDLQRVLCCLGLKEGCNLDNCRRMINAVTSYGDGKLQFDEFLRFMEKCF